MEKEFISYTEALDMKELGFDEDVFAYKLPNEDNPAYTHIKPVWAYQYSESSFGDMYKTGHYPAWIPLPLYQQCFRWFRGKYNIYHNIYHVIEEEGSGYVFEAGYTNSKDVIFFASLTDIKNTYEEAQLACLQQLISICQYQLEKPK